MQPCQCNQAQLVIYNFKLRLTIYVLGFEETRFYFVNTLFQSIDFEGKNIPDFLYKIFLVKLCSRHVKRTNSSVCRRQLVTPRHSRNKHCIHFISLGRN